MENLTVLIVEDDRSQRNFMEKLLQYCRRINVLSAASVDEAKHLLDTHPVDGAILDLVLQQGSGLEVAALIQARGLPVVFVTATTDAHNMGLMYEFGFVVPKPAGIPVLTKVLEYFDYAKQAKGIQS
jgi:DNA-binding response OmpR family regulator